MLDIKDEQLEELRKFHKSKFDVNNILTTANELKYTNELKQLLTAEFDSPSVDFINYFVKKAYEGRITQKVYEQFEVFFKTALMHWKNELVNERLKAALNSSRKAQQEEAEKAAEEQQSEPETPLIVTTEMELQGFYIVRSILYGKIDNIDRIYYRDTQSYFNILMDDSIRKPICRLNFNRANKYIELFDEEKKGTKHLIESLDDIYKYTDQIIETAKRYDNPETVHAE